MGLLDFLKRRKEIQKAKEKSLDKTQNKQPEKKADKVSVAEKTEEHKKVIAREQKKSKEGKFSYDIVKDPHISEKVTNLSEKNKYVFKVYKDANKTEIKRSVEGIYGVDVLYVNLIKIPKKKRRLGGTEGFKKGYRKAVVTIREGQKIEII